MVQNLLTPEMKDMLDEAIHAELYASNLYKHLGNQLQRLGFFGAQKYFLGESKDELKHYQKIADFQNDLGAVAKVPMIEAMTDSVPGLVEALQIFYDTELELYNSYSDYYQNASPDPVVQQFLLQFLEFQRTSVGEAGDWLTRCKLVEGDKAGLLLIDQELGA